MRLITSIVLVLLGYPALSAAEVQQAPRTLSQFVEVGQAIAIKDVGLVYELRILAGGPNQLSHSVVQVSDIFIVLRDMTGTEDTIIPWTSVKSISIVRLKAANPQIAPPQKMLQK